MKNNVKPLGIIATVAIITLAMAGCPNDPAPAHVHDYEWTVTTPATCIATGTESGVCKLDPSHTTTREIAIDLVNGHDYGDWTGTVTCTEAGTGTRVCSRSETHTETDNNLQPLGHNYKYEVTTAPTCSTAGVETGTCTRDQVTTKRAIAIDLADGHDWQLTPTATAPTCTEDGNGDQICSYNNEHTQSGVIPALGHDAGAWDTIEPDCTTAGSKELRCTRDNAVLNTETIAALGHDWDIWKENQPADGIEAIRCKNDSLHVKETRTVMVFVPGGSFQMGKNLGTGSGDDVNTVHAVTLTGFYIGKYEVTQAQCRAVMGGVPGTNYGSGDAYPVYNLSWYITLQFCNRLSVMEGLTPAYRINNSTNPADWAGSSVDVLDAVEVVSGSTGYRLPTDAQWEYAAKGGNTGEAFTYAGSDTVGDVAWYRNNSGDNGGSTNVRTHAVGTKAPNGLGIYDMSGNVGEMCWDWHAYTFQDEEQTDPTGPLSGSSRVWRGGYYDGPAVNARSMYRMPPPPTTASPSLGFRVVRP